MPRPAGLHGPKVTFRLWNKYSTGSQGRCQDREPAQWGEARQAWADHTAGQKAERGHDRNLGWTPWPAEKVQPVQGPQLGTPTWPGRKPNQKREKISSQSELYQDGMLYLIQWSLSHLSTASRMLTTTYRSNLPALKMLPVESQMMGVFVNPDIHFMTFSVTLDYWPIKYN